MGIFWCQCIGCESSYHVEYILILTLQRPDTWGKVIGNMTHNLLKWLFHSTGPLESFPYILLMFEQECLHSSKLEKWCKYHVSPAHGIAKNRSIYSYRICMPHNLINVQNAVLSALQMVPFWRYFFLEIKCDNMHNWWMKDAKCI